MSRDKALSNARYMARLVAGMDLDFSLEGCSELDARCIVTLRITQKLLTTFDGIKPLVLHEDGGGDQSQILSSPKELSDSDVRDIAYAWATLSKHGVRVENIERLGDSAGVAS